MNGINTFFLENVSFNKETGIKLLHVKILLNFITAGYGAKGIFLDHRNRLYLLTKVSSGGLYQYYMRTLHIDLNYNNNHINSP